MHLVPRCCCYERHRFVRRLIGQFHFPGADWSAYSPGWLAVCVGCWFDGRVFAASLAETGKQRVCAVRETAPIGWFAHQLPSSSVYSTSAKTFQFQFIARIFSFSSTFHSSLNSAFTSVFFPVMLSPVPLSHTHAQPFNGLWSGTTRVGRVPHKKHSPTHTHPDHQTSFINFLHLLRSTASSVLSLRAWQSFSVLVNC